MSYMINLLRKHLQLSYEYGEIWDKELVQGLDRALEVADRRLGGLGGTDSGVQVLYVVADTIESQADIRMKGDLARNLASGIRQFAGKFPR